MLESNVTSFLDPATGVVSPSDLTWGFFPPRSLIPAGKFVYATLREVDQVGAPYILHRIDSTTGQAVNLGANLGTIFDTFDFPVDGRHRALLVRETAVDLHGDGDISDHLIHVVKP